MNSENGKHIRNEEQLFFPRCRGFGLLLVVLSAITVNAQGQVSAYTPNDPGQESVINNQLGLQAAWGMRGHVVPSNPKGTPVIVIMGKGLVGYNPELENSSWHQFDADLRSVSFDDPHEPKVLGSAVAQTDNGIGIASPGGLYYGVSPFRWISIAIGSVDVINGQDMRAGFQKVLDRKRLDGINVVLVICPFTVNDNDTGATHNLLVQMANEDIGIVCSAGESFPAQNLDNFSDGVLAPVCWSRDGNLIVWAVTGLDDNGTFLSGDYFGEKTVQFAVPARSIPTVSLLFDGTGGNARISETSGAAGLFAGVLFGTYLNTEQDLRVAILRLKASCTPVAFTAHGLPNMGTAILMPVPTPDIDRVEWNGLKKMDVYGANFSSASKVFINDQEVSSDFVLSVDPHHISIKGKAKKIGMKGDPGTEKRIKVIDKEISSNVFTLTL